RQFEQAESIALEVKQWGLSDSLLDDTPETVAAAARALRRRDKIRNTAPREQSSQGVYDLLVQESRQLMKAGRLDEADAKARMAQRMDVVPALTADRAESVLHEIAMARAQTSPGTAPVQPGTPLPALAVGGESNALLAKADPPLPAPASDPAVEKMAGIALGAGPDLVAPAEDSAAAQPKAIPA